MLEEGETSWFSLSSVAFSPQAFQNSQLANPTPLYSCSEKTFLTENTGIFWNIHEIPWNETVFLQIVKNSEHGEVFNNTCDMIGVMWGYDLQTSAKASNFPTLENLGPDGFHIQSNSALAKKIFFIQGGIASKSKCSEKKCEKFWKQGWRNLKHVECVKLSNLGLDGSFMQSNPALVKKIMAPIMPRNFRGEEIWQITLKRCQSVQPWTRWLSYNSRIPFQSHFMAQIWPALQTLGRSIWKN